tara:strand:- start:140 stop:601 length:462 start_codon:yes stop_codon:yes gene_type:complete
MALVLDTSYSNAFWDDVIDNIKGFLTGEFAIPIYVSPIYKENGNFAIRIWGESSETVEFINDGWTKRYDCTIAVYFKESKPNQIFYKRFYQDVEKVYQLLFNNKNVSASGSNNGFIDGVVSGTSINELDAIEEEVSGLHVAKLSYQCLVNRNN